MNRFNPQRRTNIGVAFTREDRRHKFSVGETVTLVSRAGDVRSKDLEQELLNGAFEITRLLPEQARSFEYRIKNATTGRERVVAEDQIVALTQ